MCEHPFPTSQGQLIRVARGERTQTEFARTLGVDRSCLSRYESEALGAPPAVISHCLQVVASSMTIVDGAWNIHEALKHARLAVASLEMVAGHTRSGVAEVRPNNRGR